MANLCLVVEASTPPLACSRGKERGGMLKTLWATGSGSRVQSQGHPPGPAYLPATGAGTDRCSHRLLETLCEQTFLDPW